MTSNEMSETPSTLYRFLRGFLAFLVISGLFLLFGSIYMRSLVIQRLNALARASSSVVLTRPFPLEPGLQISSGKLFKRLTRLGYQEVQQIPERAGEYRMSQGSLDVFLHDVSLPRGDTQPSERVILSLDGENAIRSVHDAKFGRELPAVYLEGEILSLLGNSSTRASLPKRLDQFSPYLVGAVIAIEDERFPSHYGIDPVAVARALLADIAHGAIVQGGSTITQQLAKNLFLSSKRSLSRKLLEGLAAILLETAYTKHEILEFYLNQVFLGQEGNVAIHGFGEAAMAFFGKDVSDLSLAEAAVLAGIIKAPSSYSPRRYPDRAKERRAVVLAKMLEMNLVTAAEAHQATIAPLKVIPPTRTRRVAPYFTDYIRLEVDRLLESSHGVANDLQVFTGIDREYQDCAEQKVQAGLLNLEKTYSRVRRKSNPLQSALIAVDPADGTIRAWVGGRNYGNNQFDRVSAGFRQPGSAFKPFVYLTALDKSLNSYRVARATTLLLDAPVTIDVPGSGPWEPKDYEDTYRGEVTLREALTYSLNIPTVELAQKVGIRSIAHTAELFGFGSDLPQVPALALGAGEVSPYRLARAYTALAAEGQLIELRPLLAITAEHAEHPLYVSNFQEQRVASEAAVYVLTTIMQDVLDHGTGAVVRRLGFTRPAAGKTGTSSDTRDSWFAGFTPRLLTVVWVGFDDNQETGLTGAQGAGPIWTEFMKCASPLGPELDFIPPPGVVRRNIDKPSGLLASADCGGDEVISEVFVEGTEPITPCTSRGWFASRDPVFPTPSSQPQHRPRERRAESEWNRFWDNLFGSR